MTTKRHNFKNMLQNHQKTSRARNQFLASVTKLMVLIKIRQEISHIWALIESLHYKASVETVLVSVK